MKDKKIQEQKKINLQLRNKKKQKLKEKGITLIALVVTIIILLILAGVTLNMALSGDGLFSRARNAANKYKKAQEDEQELISEIGKEMNSEYIGAKITWNDFEKKNEENAYKVEADKSGTGKEQTFETEELGWRIWDYDGTTIRIISEKPTTKTLTLKGTAGYNNGVSIINEICRQCYGQYEANSKKERTGIKVANLRRSDIQKVSTYDYSYIDESKKEESEAETIKFGQTKKYLNGNTKYPALWGLNDQKWEYEYKNGKTIGDKECLIWEIEEIDNEVLNGFSDGDENTTFKQSFYSYDYKNRDEFRNKKYFDMIFYGYENNESPLRDFWLAGRYAFLLGEQCDFGIMRINNRNGKNELTGFTVCQSNGNELTPSYAIRPIVSINLETSGYSLKKDENNDSEYVLE